MEHTKKSFAAAGGTRAVITIVIALVAFGLGYFVSRHSSSVEPVPKPAAVRKAQIWTCSMHPQIRQPNPGRCPICGMDLIPVSGESEEEETGPRTFVTTPEAEALMDVQTSPVERRFVTAEIRMVGKVDYDETRLASITAWVAGRIERLFVDYTGMPVKKGDHMVILYSPELFAAQAELLQALRAVKELQSSDVAIVKETAQATVQAAREKLRLLGLTVEQIDEIEKRGTPADRVTIYAPTGGIVIQKNAQQGMHVDVGATIYTIADLSEVWMKLDAYESDLMWVRYGQTVAFTAEAYPGETFVGTIAFIEPTLNPTTRTVKVRVNVPNPDGKLKPEMFVRAVVRAGVTAGGKVMDADLAGKWICPMHPEVVKDAAGKCDRCEMPLVRTESLGYVSAGVDASAAPLVIPASAPLVTGKRAVVYVKVVGASKPTYEGHEVLLGPRAGDFYLVREGLQEGELVVTRGNFKIDSALQIQAKRSMMSPEGGAAVAPHHDVRPAQEISVPPEFQRQLSALFKAYLAVHEALSKDDANAAARAVARMSNALNDVDMRLLDGDAHVLWMKELSDLQKSLDAASKAKDIEAIRSAFAPLSEELAATLKAFGTGSSEPVYRLTCPMAFDNRGATWLQKDKDVRNPYLGGAMLKCGDVTETIGGQSEPAEDRRHE